MNHAILRVLPLLAAPLALAQPAPTTPDTQPATPEARTSPERLERRLDEIESARTFAEIDIRARGMFGADGKQTGSFDKGRVDATLSWNTSLNDTTRLRLAASTSQSYFDFDGVEGVMPGTDDPWDHLQAYRLGATLFTRVNETWSWLVGADLRLAFESGADLEDSLEVRGVLGAEYRVDPNLAFTFGVAGGTQIEDDALIIPLLGIDWRIDERTRLVSRELGLLLSYQITDHWTIGGFGSFEFRDWRLDDSRAVNPGGVAREKSVVLGVEAKYRPSNTFEFGLEAGAIAWSKLKSLDDTGRKIGEQEFEPAPFLGLSMIIRF